MFVEASGSAAHITAWKLDFHVLLEKLIGQPAYKRDFLLMKIISVFIGLRSNPKAQLLYVMVGGDLKGADSVSNMVIQKVTQASLSRLNRCLIVDVYSNFVNFTRSSKKTKNKFMFKFDWNKHLRTKKNKHQQTNELVYSNFTVVHSIP